MSGKLPEKPAGNSGNAGAAGIDGNAGDAGTAETAGKSGDAGTAGNAGEAETAETAGNSGNAGAAETSGTDGTARTVRTARTARIAHIGIAVRNLDEALRLYHDTLGLPLHGRETVESDRVTVAFLPIGDTQVELLEATDPESPVARFIEKRGEGVHHVAFEVDDVDEALEILREQGFRLIDETPRAGAGGARVAFVHPRTTNGVLIELCEKDADRQ